MTDPTTSTATSSTSTPPTLYITPTGDSALFINGEATAWATVILSAPVRRIIDLAGVRLVENVDRRALSQDQPNSGPVWRKQQTDVEARLAQLAKAAELRAAAVQTMQEAARLENEEA